jgi:hypothetical protein
MPLVVYDKVPLKFWNRAHRNNKSGTTNDSAIFRRIPIGVYDAAIRSLFNAKYTSLQIRFT